MSDLPKVIHPFYYKNSKAGQAIPLADSLNFLGLEILGQRSDLLELAQDPRKSTQEQDSYKQRVVDLERIAIAIQSLAVQLDPEKYSPQSLGVLLDLAKKNHVTLPDWMTDGKE